MPKKSEHEAKYLENKYIINEVLSETNKEHCNWVSTICFYAALHIVEMQLAADNIHSKNHIEREQYVKNSTRLGLNVFSRYKQMYTMSIMARYGADSVSPTIANQMRRYLKQIEELIENQAS